MNKVEESAIASPPSPAPPSTEAPRVAPPRVAGDAPDAGAGGRSRRLKRGSHLSTPLGVIASVVILGLCAFTVYWTQSAQIQSLRDAREAHLQASMEIFAGAVESFMANGDQTAIKRLTVEMARHNTLIDCRILTADGAVIASSERTEIASRSITDFQQLSPLGDAIASSGTDDAGVWQGLYPLTLGGREVATLEASAIIAPDADGMILTRNIAGLGSAGLLGLAGVMVGFNRLRTRTEGLGYIRDSLRAIEGGETEAQALRISEHLVGEARVLNKLLSDVARLTEQALGERIDETLAASGGGGTDLKYACDALRQGLIVLDENLHAVYANGAGAIYVQTRRDELVGKPVDQFITNQEVTDTLREAMESETAIRRTVNVDRSGEHGTDSLRFSIRTIDRGNSRNVVLVIEDITQQRVAEESRAAFVAHATHELRMPLTNIRLYLETALEEGENDPKLRGECLNVINNESKRLEDLVGDMLSMSEIEAGSLTIEKDDVRLDALFADLEKDFKAHAVEKRIDLKFDLPPKLPVLLGDRGKITIALQNLLGNAIKYTPEEGSVTVDVDTGDGQLIVEVTDTGIGMDETTTAKVFEKFFRSDDERVRTITGSGLGMALSREIIRLHGGEIKVASQLNEGSTFTLTIPLGMRAE